MRRIGLLLLVGLMGGPGLPGQGAADRSGPWPALPPKAPLANVLPTLERALGLLGVEADGVLPGRDRRLTPPPMVTRARTQPLLFARQGCALGRLWVETFTYRFAGLADLAAQVMGVGADSRPLPVGLAQAEVAKVAPLIKKVGLPRSTRGAILTAVRSGLAAWAEVAEARKGLGREGLARLIGQLRSRDLVLGLARFDRTRVLRAGRRLLRLTGEYRLQPPQLELSKLPVLSPPPSGYAGDIRLVIATSGGDLVVGGPGHSVYRKRALMILDAGGDDLYLEGVGGTSLDHPVSVVVDLGGKDLYLSKTQPGQGAGLCGVGLVVDLGRGDDVYLGGDLCQGVGVGGVGVLYDDGGINVLRAGRWAQGMGLGGLGLVFPGIGSDELICHAPGQGAAWHDGVGALIDYGGDDSYTCLPSGPAKGSGQDLDGGRDVGQGGAVGQPMALGAGVVGMLIDLAGNDRYRGGDKVQGVGFRDGLGLLLDCGSGRDHLQAGHHSQGCGLAYGAGLLVVDRGDTLYEGGSHSQGVGVDGGLGVLVDRGGADRYYGLANSQGVARKRGCGLLVDLAGDDRRIAVGKSAQGWGDRWDGWGAVALLLDGAGRDTYTGLGRDGAWVPHGMRGLTVDLATPKSEEKQPIQPEPIAGGSKLPEAKPENLHALVERGLKDEDRSAVADLLAGMGEPAMKFLVKRFFTTRKGVAFDDWAGGHWRLMEEVSRRMGDPAARVLLGLYPNADPLAKVNLLHRMLWLNLLGATGSSLAQSRLEAILVAPKAPVGREQDSLLHLAAFALGKVGTVRIPSGVRYLLASSDPDSRVAAARALAGTVHAEVLDLLWTLALDGSAKVRDAAVEGLARRHRESAPALARRLADLSGPRLRWAIVALGRLGNPAVAADLLPHLKGTGQAKVWTAARALLALGDKAALKEGAAILDAGPHRILDWVAERMRKASAAE